MRAIARIASWWRDYWVKKLGRLDDAHQDVMAEMTAKLFVNRKRAQAVTRKLITEGWHER